MRRWFHDARKFKVETRSACKSFSPKSCKGEFGCRSNQVLVKTTVKGSVETDACKSETVESDRDRPHRHVDQASRKLSTGGVSAGDGLGGREGEGVGGWGGQHKDEENASAWNGG